MILNKESVERLFDAAKAYKDADEREELIAAESEYSDACEYFMDVSVLPVLIRTWLAVADAPEGEIFAGEHDRFVGVNVPYTPSVSDWMCAHHGQRVRLVPTSGEGE